MWQGKNDKYAEYFNEMAQHNLRHKPVVMSCYGGLHPEAAVTPERIAMQAARKQGVTNHGSLLRRTKAAPGWL